MKTKSKYLSFGTVTLITLIILVQLSDGFSGLLILPISRFVYYGLTMSLDMPVIIQFTFLCGLFLLVVRILWLSYSGKFDLFRFRLNLLQPVSGNGIVYLAGQRTGITKGSSPDDTAASLRRTKNSADEDGIVMISSGCIMFANKTFFKLTGYKPEEILGTDFASLIRPESLLSYTMLSRMSAAEIGQTKGINLITKKGNIIIARLTGNNDRVFNPDDINLFSIIAQDADRTRESSLSTLFFDSIENINTLHWIWDRKGIIYMNNSCRAILPFALGQIISKPGLMLKAVRKQDRDIIRHALQQFFTNGSFNEDICCILSNYEKRYYRVSISIQAENEMFPKRYHAIAYDITEEKLSVIQAETAAQLAENANNNKTAFLANMSHEIRSPLNGIIGFSELLADKNLTDAERSRYLSIIQNNGNALISLLSDLIDISKLESGKLVIANRDFIPATLLDELKYQFESSAIGKSKDVNIIFSSSLSFQHQSIKSDPNRIRQILVNLITNAIKFTTTGRIEIGTDFSDEEMLFWVKDTGIGIPYEKQNAIFERFRQVERPGESPVIGFGLGLAISKALVELLGGKLWVESVPEFGSLFTFTIKTNIVNSTMETIQMNNSSYPHDFKERTILIAEDIDFSFLYIEAVLRRTGVKILWAQNGKEAVELVKTNLSIDLILMDMHMPIMNGYEATEMITQLRPEVPIIAQTAFVLPEDMKKCYAAGCVGYLSKPIRKEQLLSTLAEYFEKIEQEEAGHAMYKINVG